MPKSIGTIGPVNDKMETIEINPLSSSDFAVASVNKTERAEPVRQIIPSTLLAVCKPGIGSGILSIIIIMIV